VFDSDVVGVNEKAEAMPVPVMTAVIRPHSVNFSTDPWINACFLLRGHIAWPG
jgi:hypothetical protein